uniref:Uncharacterized protein n=1 Tax=Capsaspora owczarzaki TaxID=192875 RepID=M1K3C1_9EUKA|nr:hypothetical protein [Capsaspora owczarzaki]
MVHYPYSDGPLPHIWVMAKPTLELNSKVGVLLQPYLIQFFEGFIIMVGWWLQLLYYTATQSLSWLILLLWLIILSWLILLLWLIILSWLILLLWLIILSWLILLSWLIIIMIIITIIITITIAINIANVIHDSTHNMLYSRHLRLDQ